MTQANNRNEFSVPMASNKGGENLKYLNQNEID